MISRLFIQGWGNSRVLGQARGRLDVNQNVRNPTQLLAQPDARDGCNVVRFPHGEIRVNLHVELTSCWSPVLRAKHFSTPSTPGTFSATFLILSRESLAGMVSIKSSEVSRMTRSPVKITTRPTVKPP